MKRIISLALALTMLCSAFGAKKIRVLTIGDSTMANYDEVKNSGENEMRGWGQLLQMYFNEDVTVDNTAKNGRSSKSFYYEFWEKLRESINPGDYVVIQFGHNDEKNKGQDSAPDDRSGRGTAAWGQYQEYLTRYISETRKRGGIPILATPIVRALFNEDGKSLSAVGLHNLKDNLKSDNDTLYDYVLAMKDVAKRLNVPIVDMTAMTEKEVLNLGYSKAKEIIYCSHDDTHLKARGALLYAGFFAKDLKKQGILSEYFSFPYEVSSSPQELDFGSLITGESSLKTLSLYAVDLKSSQRISLMVSAPFAASLSPSRGFSNKVELQTNIGDFYQPIYIRFSPDTGDLINKQFSLQVDGKNQKSITLSGKGIAANKKTAFAYEYSSRHGLYSPKNAELKTNLVGLKYIVDLAETSVTTTDGNWIPEEIDVNSNRYFEFSIKAKKDIYLTSIAYRLTGAPDDKMQFTALGSYDTSFANADTYSLMENMSMQFKQYSQKVMIKLKKGKTYYFRIYPWSKTGGEDKAFKIESVVFRGYEAK